MQFEDLSDSIWLGNTVPLNDIDIVYQQSRG